MYGKEPKSNLNCAYHPNHPADGFCNVCNNNICSECIRYKDGQMYCTECYIKSVSKEIKKVASKNKNPLILFGVLLVIFAALFVPRRYFDLKYNKYEITDDLIDPTAEPQQFLPG